MVKNRIINGVGHVYIDDEIGKGGITGGDISRQIMDFKANGLHVKVNINSIGGSVFDGYQIIDAIVQTQADTHVSGMAASIAGIIALFGANRTINDFGVIMIHAPKGGASDLLDIVRNRLKTILKEKTNFQEEQINDMLDGEKDFWFDAYEAHQMGIVTSSPIETGKHKPIEMAMLDINQQFEVINKLKSEINMDSVKNRLGLLATATENEVLNKIQSLEDQVKSKEEQLCTMAVEKEELENKIKGLEDISKKQAEEAAKTLVKNAVEAGKIEKDSSEAWEQAAIENYERTEKQIEGLAVQHSSHVVDVVIPQDNEDLTKDDAKLKAFMRSDKAADLKATNEKLYNKYQEAYLKLI